MTRPIIACCLVIGWLAAQRPVEALPPDQSRPQVAVYYFGDYHVDPRNERLHGPGWTEWELVKAARPRWPGHRQPNIPLWGYTDEADPVEMGRKIDAAADHGIDAFIFDWYYYDDGPFLQRALDQGYLRASNRVRVKFALMWANHDWKDIHPRKLAESPRVLYPGAVRRSTFDRIVRHVIEDYFAVPSYWKIDGCPYFSIYDLPKLIDGLGGIEATADALRSFRAATKASGYRNLHLNLVNWQESHLYGGKEEQFTPSLLAHLGFDSITSYVWIHHIKVEPFPVMPYRAALDKYMTYVHQVGLRFPGLPYYPNATMGWDSSPRTVQTDVFENTGYPFMGTFGDNTPENFRRALATLKAWLATRPSAERILTINAWNEWTEGSYLEPDTRNGMAYLDEIRSVFGR